MEMVLAIVAFRMEAHADLCLYVLVCVVLSDEVLTHFLHMQK